MWLWRFILWARMPGTILKVLQLALVLPFYVRKNAAYRFTSSRLQIEYMWYTADMPLCHEAKLRSSCNFSA